MLAPVHAVVDVINDLSVVIRVHALLQREQCGHDAVDSNMHVNRAHWLGCGRVDFLESWLVNTP